MQNPWSWIVLVAVILAVIILKQRSQVSVDVARRLLGPGATVIDVRSPSEYSSGHIPGVINLPSDVLTEKIPAIATDKSAPVFLHCQSGSRSAMAARNLRAMGYSEVFNLGSLGRARSLCEAAGIK